MIPPNIDSSTFNDLQLMEDNDKLTPGKINKHSQQHFLHVEGSLRDTRVMGEKAFFHIITPVLKLMTRASWSDFQQAAAQMTMADNRNVIGDKTLLRAAYRWTQVHGERQDDSRPLFTNGLQMDPRSIEEWRSTPFPIPLASA